MSITGSNRSGGCLPVKQDLECVLASLNVGRSRAVGCSDIEGARGQLARDFKDGWVEEKE